MELTQEQREYLDLQELELKPWYKLLMESVDEEIQEYTRSLVDWIDGWNDVKWNAYDLIREQLKFLEWFREKVSQMKDQLSPVEQGESQDL